MTHRMAEQAERQRFDAAKYYTCRDTDELTHTEDSGALNEALEEAWENGDGDSYRQALERIAPITVEAYSPIEVTDKDLAALAERVADYEVVEWFDEHYGNPDSPLELDQDSRRELVSALADALRVVKRWHVWRCEQVASREYSAEEIVELLGPAEARRALEGDDDGL
jgi:hypothetical protein